MKLLSLVTVLAVSSVVCMISCFQESRSVSDFAGAKVKGNVNEFRPGAIAKITPDLLKRVIGEEYFQTVHSASVHLYLNPAERQRYHRKQSPELAIRCISNFQSVHYLDLRFAGAGPFEAIDLSPLGRCSRIHQLELHRPNSEIVQDICTYTRPKCLAVCACELDDEMIEAIAANPCIESIQFNFCAVNARQLQSLESMESLCLIHFFQCKPIEKADGSFDFQIEPMTGGSWSVANEEHDVSQKAKAAAWLKQELPDITISGLN